MSVKLAVWRWPGLDLAGPVAANSVPLGRYQVVPTLRGNGGVNKFSAEAGFCLSLSCALECGASGELTPTLNMVQLDK